MEDYVNVRIKKAGYRKIQILKKMIGNDKNLSYVSYLSIGSFMDYLASRFISDNKIEPEFLKALTLYQESNYK